MDFDYFSDILADNEKEYDVRLIAEKMRQFLMKEGVETAGFKLDESDYYDGIAVSYMERIPMLGVQVKYGVRYDWFYREDSYFSAIVRVPRGELKISDLECREIAAKCISCPDMVVSFEGDHMGKHIGFFHVINTVSGRHVMDLKEMQQHLHEVRRVVTDIAKELFERYSELYIVGQCKADTTIAKFEQVDSMEDDDRITETDYFDELSYDPADPINLEATLTFDPSELHDLAGSRIDKI